MAEYIKREDAVNKAERLRDKCADGKMAFALNWFITLLNDVPAADVVEVKRGKWTDHRTMEHDGEWYCTACGEEITIYMGADRHDRYRYCPNCGAKMEGGQDDV